MKNLVDKIEGIKISKIDRGAGNCNRIRNRLSYTSETILLKY